jgi:hypothetical protein
MPGNLCSILAGHLVIIINRLRQGRIAGFQGKNAAPDGMATVLGVGFGVFECNRLLRVCEQTAQTCDKA